MLSDVLGIVDGEGWFDMTQPFEQTIYLSQGSAQCVLLSRGGKPECFVKFTNLMSLAAEAQRLGLSAARFPQHAPQLVGYAHRARLEVLATRAVSFSALSGRMMLSGKTGAAVCAGLEDLFRRMRGAALQCGGAGRRHLWFDDMREYFAAAPQAPAAAHGLRQLADAMDTLAPLAQHGDMVLNNIGVRPDKSLVVFDWEDYGAVELPGLDLFTLENSIERELGEQAARRTLDLPRLCGALGLSVQQYEALRLGYALAFRYLKRNYNQEVRSRLDTVIERLASAQLAQSGRA